MVSGYSVTTSAHNIVLFLFPGEVGHDQIPDENVDDTRLGKYHVNTLFYIWYRLAQYYDLTSLMQHNE